MHKLCSAIKLKTTKSKQINNVPMIASATPMKPRWPSPVRATATNHGCVTDREGPTYAR